MCDTMTLRAMACSSDNRKHWAEDVDIALAELGALVADLATARSDLAEARAECNAMVDTCKDLGTEIAELRVDRNKWMLRWKSAEGFAL